jgi:hypothetical protein
MASFPKESVMSEDNHDATVLTSIGRLGGQMEMVIHRLDIQDGTLSVLRSNQEVQKPKLETLVAIIREVRDSQVAATALHTKMSEQITDIVVTAGKLASTTTMASKAAENDIKSTLTRVERMERWGIRLAVIFFIALMSLATATKDGFAQLGENFMNILGN